MGKADSGVLRPEGESCSEGQKHDVTLGELQDRCPNTEMQPRAHTHIMQSHTDSYPAGWLGAAVVSVYHIPVMKVTSLFCPACTSVMDLF